MYLPEYIMTEACITSFCAWVSMLHSATYGQSRGGDTARDHVVSEVHHFKINFDVVLDTNTLEQDLPRVEGTSEIMLMLVVLLLRAARCRARAE